MRVVNDLCCESFGSIRVAFQDKDGNVQYSNVNAKGKDGEIKVTEFSNKNGFKKIEYWEKGSDEKSVVYGKSPQGFSINKLRNDGTYFGLSQYRLGEQIFQVDPQHQIIKQDGSMVLRIFGDKDCSVRVVKQNGDIFTLSTVFGGDFNQVKPEFEYNQRTKNLITYTNEWNKKLFPRISARKFVRLYEECKNIRQSSLKELFEVKDNLLNLAVQAKKNIRL